MGAGIDIDAAIREQTMKIASAIGDMTSNIRAHQTTTALSYEWLKNIANHGVEDDGRPYSEIVTRIVGPKGMSFEELDKRLFEHLPTKDTDEGMPMWDYVAKVAKALHQDAYYNMEGCDGDEWMTYNQLILLADQLRGMAERMNDHGGR